MLELFSCRNCVQNCAQSLNIGRGHGFCLQHNSVITEPEKTTCKYLQRKDMPLFVVDEGIREHAAQFALFPTLARLDTKDPVHRIVYSEKYQWETRSYDPLTNAIAQYFTITPAWAFIQSFSGGNDGRRSIAHAAFVRRYMHHCDSWVSSYRLILGLVQEVDVDPFFSENSLYVRSNADIHETTNDALWDVVFCRLSGIQEYGWHAGIEPLMWASDSVNGGLSELNWNRLKEEFGKVKGVWTSIIIDHAKSQKEFFHENQFYRNTDEGRGENEKYTEDAQ